MNPVAVFTLAVGFAMPELLNTRSLAMVRPAASASNVPVVRASVPVPNAVLLPATVMRLPVRNVPPVYVLLPVRKRLPVPARNSDPEPPIAPEKSVCALFVTETVLVKFAGLFKVIGPAKVTLLLPAMVTRLALNVTAFGIVDAAIA